MATQSSRLRWHRRILAVIIIPLVLLLCVLIVTFGLDQMCYSSLTQRLPLYPGAKVVLEKHSGMRAFGMGETLMILETDDPIAAVRDWYGRNAGGAIRRMTQSGQGFLMGMTDVTYSMVPAEGSTGTQITLNGVCGA